MAKIPDPCYIFNDCNKSSPISVIIVAENRHLSFISSLNRTVCWTTVEGNKRDTQKGTECSHNCPRHKTNRHRNRKGLL